MLYVGIGLKVEVLLRSVSHSFPLTLVGMPPTQCERLRDIVSDNGGATLASSLQQPGTYLAK